MRSPSTRPVAFASPLAGALAVAVGALVLLGWTFDVAAWKSLSPAWVSMKPNTALAFLLAGTALLALRPRPSAQDPRFPRFALARLCALLAGLIGALTLAEYAAGRSFGIDQLLFREAAGAVATTHPGRMAPDTALCFLLWTAGLEIARSPRRTLWTLLASILLGGIVSAIGLLALLSYAALATPYQWFGFTPMAVHTAVLFAGLGLGLVELGWRNAKGLGLTQFSSHLWGMLGCLGALVLAFVLLSETERQADRAHLQRFESLRLAEELRQSTDDLTRMARTYAVTGVPLYRKHYQDILDIRDGRRARPVEYQRPYWDLVLEKGPGPRPDGPAVALLDLMRRAGFTAEEFDRLAQAKARSDVLARREFEAMQLAESNAEADRTRARILLYDASYHQIKAEILGSIDWFMESVDQRTFRAVRTAEGAVSIFNALFALTVLGLVVMLWRTYAALCRTLGGTVDEVDAAIARIGSGDFATPIRIEKHLEGGVLAGLTTAQAKLQALHHERERAQESLRRLNAELEDRVQERTTVLQATIEELEAFSYSVSHDLRTPLRAIVGFGRILVEEKADQLDGEGRHMLDRILRAATRGGQLVDDLLAFARLGRQPLVVAAIDMNALVRETFEEQVTLAPARNLRLELAPLPPACGDPTMLRVVLANLLSNAIKYSQGRDPGLIEVGGRTDTEEVVYFITDNGVGFDMKYADKLFEVFQRLHARGEFEGTGVGLALVQRIIQRHGGRVWGESVLGEGATFQFSLPHLKGSP